jgi:hypothetical protein
MTAFDTAVVIAPPDGTRPDRATMTALDTAVLIASR